MKKRLNLIFLFSIAFLQLPLIAQTEIELRTDALVVPRTTAASVMNVEKGMIIFDTSASELMLYDGNAWKILSHSCPTGNIFSGSSIPPMCCEEQLTNGFAGDNFGETVALYGDRVLIGLPGAFGGGKFNIYKYDTTNMSWEFEVSINDDDLSVGDGFGEAIDIGKDRVVIGAPRYEVGSDILQRGGVFAYRFVNGAWSSGSLLNNADEEDFAEFGTSASMDDEWIIAGAPKKDVDGNSDQGKVYFFQLIQGGNTWQRKAAFSGSDSDAGDQFGRSAAIDGSTAIVGAPFATDSAGARNGKVYVFLRFGSLWGEHTSFEAGDMNTDDYGSAVAISGNYFLVGAPGENSDEGAVYVYQYNGTTWENMQKLTASDGADDDKFGKSVSIKGDYAIVGAPQSLGPGKAYIFQFDGSSWNEIEIVTDPIGQNGDDFGYSVSTDSVNRAVGAPGADPNGFDDKGKVSLGPVDD